MVELDNLSDHLYVEFGLSFAPPPFVDRGAESGDNRQPRRWSVKDLDEDRLVAALLVGTWASGPANGLQLEKEVDWFRRTLWNASDVAMTRTRRSQRRAAY